MDEAIAVLRNWTGQSPHDAAAWAALADTLATASRPDLALGAWEHALALEPRAAAWLCGKARALQAIGRPGEAAPCFEAVLAIDPTSDEARFGLARLAFEGGDLDGAAGHMARLLIQAAPAASWLGARLALARGELAPALAAMETLLAGPLDEAQRADALLLQGEILDRQGDYPKAFAAAREGKAIQKRLFAARAAGHEGETAKLQRLKAWFEAADPGPWRAAPPAVAGDAEGHVFLVGFPRSGTTLIEQALAGHPHVVALEEAPTLADHYQEFLRDPDGLARLARIGVAEAQAWRARYWRTVREHGAEPRGRVLLDKAPAGTLNLPVIVKLFPGAKILFAVRDPRDVVLSCAMNAFQMNSLTYTFTDLVGAAQCYAACMALAQTYRQVLPLDLIEVRHEALVEDFPGHLAAIAAFVGLSFDPSMTDIATTALGRPVRTPSAIQVRAGLSRQGLGRWRNYAAELAPVSPTLALWIGHFGYPADRPGAAG
jgi:Tfp pilus assembly protein PilF